MEMTSGLVAPDLNWNVWKSNEHAFGGEAHQEILRSRLSCSTGEFVEKFRAHVRAGHETLTNHCGGTEFATSKNSGFTSGEGQREGSASRRMLMGMTSKR